MLLSVGGARIFIGDDVGDAMSSPAEVSGAGHDWQEITAAESLGFLGISWETHSFTPDDADPQFTVSVKTNMAGQAMQLILALDPEDPGQTRLSEALHSRSDYAFRLDFPDGINRRLWRASVISFSEVFDEANSVMKIQADLQINSPITRETA